MRANRSTSVTRSTWHCSCGHVTHSALRFASVRNNTPLMSTRRSAAACGARCRGVKVGLGDKRHGMPWCGHGRREESSRGATEARNIDRARGLRRRLGKAQRGAVREPRRASPAARNRAAVAMSPRCALGRSRRGNSQHARRMRPFRELDAALSLFSQRRRKR